MPISSSPPFRDPALVETSRRRNEAAREAMLERFGGAVRPLYEQEMSRKPVQTGSCVLLQVGGRKFIVTAAHVTDFDRLNDLLIAGEQGLIPIEGYVARTNMPVTGRRDDKSDLAHYLVSEELVQLLGPVTWIQAGDLDPNNQDAAIKRYITLGYPNSRNKRVEKSTKRAYIAPFSFLGRLRTDVDLAYLGFDAQSHIFINFDRRRIVNEKGERTNPVDPRGMSGGAVFAFDPMQMDQPPEERRVKLVGILIEKRDNPGVLIATRVSLLQAMLAHAYPDIANSFEHDLDLRIAVSTVRPP